MSQGFSEQDVPDQSGQTAVVTGANSGLGLETTRVLARAGARVVMACRDRERGERALEKVRAAAPGAQVSLASLDLGDLSSVRAFAQSFAAEHDSLDLLVNNAGIMAVPRALTVDGFESQIGVNHLGHFALTGLLLGTLLASPRPRVVSVSSVAHRTGHIRTGTFTGRGRYQRWLAYGQSKLANLLFTFELDRHASATGLPLRALAAHPGYASTNLQLAGKRRPLLDRLYAPIGNLLVAQSAAAGALPILYAATMPELPGGSFVGPDGPLEMRGRPRLVRAARRAYDLQTARELWEASERLTGVAYDFAAHRRREEQTA